MGSFIAKTKTALFAVATTLTALSAQAFQITSFSPQGEVSPIRQIVVKFDEPAVNLGEPKGGSAPLKVECTPSEGRVGSSSRWVSDKVLALDFENDLPPNVTCTAQVVAGFKSAKGVELTGTRSYKFHTGGAVVIEATPYAYRADNISEDQFFSLRFNGTVDAAKVQANVWCAVEGLGEKVSIRLIEGKERAVWLKAQRREMSEAAAKNPPSLVLFACNRAFTPASKVQVVYGKGIYFSDTVEKRSTYTVREPFNLRWSCERENAQSACLPIRPLTLTFTAPVSKEVLEAIRLQSGSTTWKPKVIHESGITFASPFPEKATLTLEFPPNFKDDAGRTLHNAPQLQITTDAMPPLAKFSAAPFGVVERFAEPSGVAVLPITLRNVESFAANLPVGKVKTLRPTTDADIIRWFLKVRQYEQSTLINKVETRAVSLLDGEKDGKGSTLKTQDLPKPVSGDPRPFEVVGIPLSAGFHVVEIASKKLGQHLLDPNQHGKDRTMYVRTSALVTNLGVHFKLGRENSLAWVTTLDKGKPVANAAVRVSDCNGKEIATAKTNAQGIAQFTGISPQAPTCNSEDRYVQAYFVSARASQPAGEGKVNESLEDLAFTWSDWNKGIESWRFNFPTSQDAAPDEIAHTILDRSLLRAGQTVSMKHLLRTQTSKGFGLPEAKPTSLTITHIGSGQQYTQPLTWRKTPTGGLSAVNTFAIPPAAKLGVYQVELRAEGNNRSFTTTSFRVEEFRLPVFEGRITPSDKKPLVGISTLPIDVQVNFVSGGGAANLPVRVSALVREKYVNYADFADFNFSPPRSNNNNNNNGDGDGDGNGDEETVEASTDEKVIANKLPVTLDKNGAGKIKLDKIPSSQKAQELVMEATYSDPNGEVQTLRSTQTLWPAGVVVGIKTEGWVSSGGKIQFQALALDVHGKPKAGVALDVKAYARITTTSRKRMVGGFYTYDNQTANKELGSLCSGQSDARGLLLCEASMTEAGEIELVATAQDGAGHSVQAASTVYVTQQGEMWFGGDNHDRIDLLPEKKNYEIGETAKFQVRMPFRFATALVTVEREGILESQIVQLNGKDPTISLKIKDEWGPNVYVSALVLRGRLREVPWYSFFTWGYKAPREWWTGFWYEGKEYVAPTAMVDLSKPAYRLGVAEIRIGTQAHQLAVSVKADKESYSVRGKAQVTIQVKLPNGQPAANAEVALAAVDQALLELMPNESWNVLEAMLQNRSWGVETSTAQMEIIGRRHYGRKAVPAGGSGGKGGTRELLDTLLLWNPAIKLDANGQATVMVPLNDALTTFQIVVIADSATGFFGTGKTSIRATQDLQIISGLPPLVREDDQFRASITLRNTTAQAMKVDVKPRATLLDLNLNLKAQTVDIPAGESREVAWMVAVPVQSALNRTEELAWEIEAKDSLSGARDALKWSQRIIPAVPLTVRQAILVQVDTPLSWDISPPADALPNRGGVKMSLQPTLAAGLPGVKDWFINYPFACLEQKTSKSVGLRDGKIWQTVAAQIPSYLDSDGLANYFPPRNGDANRGSDTLTAYLLAATHEASGVNPAFALREEVRAPMERGLMNFIEGRIQRDFWSPRKDLDMRKIAALEALSRYGKAQGRMVGSIAITPNQWPTHTVIDWYNILRRVQDVPDRAKRLAEATQILRSRISYQGTKMVFSTENEDYWWWLMQNGDVNTARLILAVMDDPAWKDDMGRLANGFISRQRNGAWHTTTANLWGGLALEKFSAKYEAVTVGGSTKANMSTGSTAVDWGKPERTMFLGWGKPQTKDNLTVTHQGSGKPWLTLQSVAAVPLKAPFNAGYQIKKTITPIEQANKNQPAGSYSRGDILRITLEVNATTDMTWVVVTDPIPTGATILGNGLGRDSEMATQGEKSGSSGSNGWVAFEERSFEAFRSYYDYMPKGVMKMEYTVRLNNAGEFSLPPSRVEAMYAPEIFGEVPNARVKVEAGK